jgi:hypothetical protein
VCTREIRVAGASAALGARDGFPPIFYHGTHARTHANAHGVRDKGLMETLERMHMPNTRKIPMP